MKDVKWNGSGQLAGSFAAVLILLSVIVGWRLFWFLTDDAFIAFRYVANSMEGYGLVWNPPPFRPVEGYTSFLWVILLKIVWTATGFPPPVTANILSLAFGLMTIILVTRIIEKLPLPPAVERYRWICGLIVLVGIVTNRTYLAWLSSGLETSLFNLLLTWWLYAVFSTGGTQLKGFRVLSLTLSSALLALCRPEGVLMAGATAVILVVRSVMFSPPRLRESWTCLPLLASPGHFIWRRIYYGQWLPNTYYAKNAGAWPEAGARYLASFILEYGLWMWMAFLAAWFFRRQGSRRNTFVPAVAERSTRIVALSAVGFELFYYTFIVGGDHFEFRIFSWTVPLLFLTAMYFVSWTVRRAVLAPVMLLFFVLASWPIPWTHWALSQEFTTRQETFKLTVPVAQRLPVFLKPLGSTWDHLQSWLIDRLVCVRHQEHKVAWLHQSNTLPPRSVGSEIGWEERPVISADAVGVLGWNLPGIAIIDRFGLNDHVIARTPLSREADRQMAHDRKPPVGYVECFSPNVNFVPYGQWLIPVATSRETPLSDTEIKACEDRFW